MQKCTNLKNLKKNSHLKILWIWKKKKERKKEKEKEANMKR